MPSSPQALANPKDINIKVQRLDLGISSLFFPSTLPCCAMVLAFSMCPNIARKPCSPPFQLLPNPWDQLSMLHPYLTGVSRGMAG